MVKGEIAHDEIIRMREWVKTLYFMLNDKILCSFNEIKSISLTDITHTVSDIGMPELLFYLYREATILSLFSQKLINLS